MSRTLSREYTAGAGFEFVKTASPRLNPFSQMWGISENAKTPTYGTCSSSREMILFQAHEVRLPYYLKEKGLIKLCVEYVQDVSWLRREVWL